MAVIPGTSLLHILFLLQTLWEDLYYWLNFDPIGIQVMRLIFMLSFGIITYLVCIPFMYRKIEERTSLRDGSVPEWDTDSN